MSVSSPRPLWTAAAWLLSLSLSWTAACSAADGPKADGPKAEGAKAAETAQPWVVYEGTEGLPGSGKRVVLISGDEEYRSEEALPQLGKILAERHGFRCTVLFAIDPKTGEISPETSDNIPGLEALADADLMIIATRFRNLPDAQMEKIVQYIEAGRPVVGMRTATHAFNIPADRRFARYSWNYKGDDYRDGFGRQVLGETWISHHGRHKFESTRGIIAPGAEDHPIVRGIGEAKIWGTTDVYGVRLPLPQDSKPLVLGQVLSGMQPDSPPLAGEKNTPMMPIAWTKTYRDGRVFCTTMGAATDLLSEGVRRMLVAGVYWASGLEEQIQADMNVDLVGDFEPTEYGFGAYKKGLRPADFGR
ncbi:ThuA domain-containing protein [Candidatus Laterigemmans baculatus]|uniref:ThuA domain-containing protein n=1 Tax=Candidatus Laterigemmans baculatus TaxID=2770505 RepID=UPI0013DB1953|nr:ThuA domain-containing protein [Candidatus Laterigemmans baculatus]